MSIYSKHEIGKIYDDGYTKCKRCRRSLIVKLNRLTMGYQVVEESVITGDKEGCDEITRESSFIYRGEVMIKH